jgi:sec-independent protein translocase protein TatC
MGTVIVFSIIGYYVFPFFVEALHNIIGEDLYATGITEGFLARFKSAILFGIFGSIPILFSEIVLFIFPALNKKQKITLVIVIFIVFLLFIAGVTLAINAVIPISINFFKSETFFPSNVSRLISYSAFIDFFFQFLFGFGVFFEFPVVLIFLMKIHVVTPKFLVKNVKYFIPAIFLIAAVLTPSTDVISQLLLATPIVILYFAAILIGKIFRLG